MTDRSAAVAGDAYSQDPFPTRLVAGFAGPAGSGKDTCAELLGEFGFARIAFADALRIEVARAFGTDWRLLTERATKEEPTRRLCIVYCADEAFRARMAQLGHDEHLPRSPRWIMQRWGTEYRRALNPHYWIEQVVAQIGPTVAAAPARVCVTDVRYPNEADAIELLGGTLAYVLRPDHGAALAEDTACHPSEPQGLARRCRRIVHNDGDLDHLRNELARVLGRGGAPAP